MPPDSSDSGQDYTARDNPALVLAVLLSAGILLARVSYGAIPGIVLAATAAVSFLLAFGIKRRPRYLKLASLLLIILSGFMLYRSQALLDRDRAGSTVVSTGQAALVGSLEGPAWEAPPEVYSGVVRRRFILRVESRMLPGEGWRPGSGKLLVEAPDAGPPLYGDERVACLAELRDPLGYSNPGLFDYRAYLASRDIRGLARVESESDIKLIDSSEGLSEILSPLDLTAHLRARLAALHDKLYPEPEVRGVAAAILLGVREQTDPDLRQDFAISGTIHVLVVSGLHVGFVAGAVYFILAFFSGRTWVSTVVTLLAVLAFALLSGARPSVLRAAFMCAVFLLAYPLQRSARPLNTLAAAFAVLLLFDPAWLFDPGFQMSFAAVAGIGILTPRFEAPLAGRAWWSKRFLRYTARLFLASCAAQLAVAPLVAWYYSRVSLVGLAANVPMIPLAGAAVMSGFAADLAALVWLPAGKILALFSGLSIRGMIGLAHQSAALPGAAFELSPPRFAGIFLYWAALWYAARLPGRQSTPGALIIIGLLWLNSILWPAPIAALQGKLRADLLDLGPSRAELLRFPSGRCLLSVPPRGVRAGYSTARQVVLPYLERHNIQRVDWLVLRTSDRASIRWAWDILDHVRVGNILIGSTETPDSLLFQFLEYAARKGASLVDAGENASLYNDRIRVSLGKVEGLRLDYNGSRLEIDTDSVRLLERGRHVLTVTTGIDSPDRSGVLHLDTSSAGAVTVNLCRGGWVEARSVLNGPLRLY